MFYIDDYYATAITDKVPQGVKKLEQVLQSPDVKTASDNTFKYFWFLMGTMIGEHSDTVEKVLTKYNIQAKGKEDVVDAVTDLYQTDKWKSFFNDIQPLFTDTIENLALKQQSIAEEKSFIGITAAVLGAVSSIAGGALSLGASKNQKDAAKATAQSNALLGVANVVAEKQKAQIALEAQRSKERRLLIGGIIAFLLIAATITGIILVKRNTATTA